MMVSLLLLVGLLGLSRSASVNDELLPDFRRGSTLMQARVRRFFFFLIIWHGSVKQKLAQSSSAAERP